MKEKKKQRIEFHMFEIPVLCEHFSDMAKHGWMLEKFRVNIATYKRCTPCDINFYISLNRRSTTANIDYVSIDDQRFSDFVEEYGLTLISRYSLYQVFVSDHPLPFHFYDDSIQEYLFDRKKQIMRYEYVYHIWPLFILSFQAFLLFYPTDIQFLHWSNGLRLLLIPIVLIMILTRSVPILLWRIKKENYCVSKKRMLTRSFVDISSLLAIILILCISLMFHEQAFILMYSYLGIMIPIFFFSFRLLFIDLKKTVCTALSILLTIVCATSLYTCMIHPYQDSQVIDVIAPYHSWDSPLESPYDFYITDKQSTFLMSSYELIEKQPIDETCQLENKDKESDTFDPASYCNTDINYAYYIIKNKMFENWLQEDILSSWNAYFEDETKDYRIYKGKYERIILTFENKVLVYRDDSANNQDMEAIYQKFK